MNMSSNLTMHIALGVLLIVVYSSNGVVSGFSSTNGKPRLSTTPTTLSVATIDGSFFDSTDDGGRKLNNIVDEVTTTARAFPIEKISSSRSTWAAIGTILSIYTALNTKAIVTSLRIFSTISSWYLSRLEVSPLLTKCITGGIIALIGDYGAQWFEYRTLHSRRRAKKNAVLSSSDPAFSLRAGGGSDATHKPSSTFSIHGTYHFRRGMARFLECLFVSSPLMHFGYDLFESIMPVVGVGGGRSGIYQSFAALSHVLADCVLLDGIFVFTGILATGLLEGHSLRRHVLPNVRNVYFPTLRASVMTSGALMPLQFLSFRFLPVQLRVLSVNAVDLIWTGVVSFVSHSGDVEKI